MCITDVVTRYWTNGTKLWPFKDALFNARSLESTRVGSVTRVLTVQILKA